MKILPMFSTCSPIILASGSPRRQQFLSRLGLDFTVQPAHIDESPLPGESPEAFVLRMAVTKARAIGENHPDSWVIGADTVITLDGSSIIGKPDDTEEAMTILTMLSGKTHQVLTGFSLYCLAKNVLEQQVEHTAVTFINATPELLNAYIQTGEPMDKAGAYGLQGLGSILVKDGKLSP